MAEYAPFVGALGTFVGIVFLFWKTLDTRCRRLESEARECAADRRTAGEARAEMRAEMKHVRADVSRALADED